jgi:hypothetical protein
MVLQQIIATHNLLSPSRTAYGGIILTACDLRVSPETAPPSFRELEVFLLCSGKKQLRERTILSIRDEKGIMHVRTVSGLFRRGPFSFRKGFFYVR